MTNWEKNKEELLKISTVDSFGMEDGQIVSCFKCDCEKCDFRFINTGKLCDEAKLEWLDEEYKEPSPYEDWEIDDRIEVSDDEESWMKVHFAGVDEYGLPQSWGTYGTSWSYGNDDNRKTSWEYARKVEE